MTPLPISGGWEADNFPPCDDPELICDRYEAAFRAGRRPRIEEALRRCPEAIRSDLLPDLLELDFALRVSLGGQPSRADYAKRFPDQTELIDRLFCGQSPPLEAAWAARALHHGLLATLTGFAAPNTFLDALRDWLPSKREAFALGLARRAAMPEAQHQLLAELVAEQLARAGNNPVAALAGLPPIGPLLHSLATFDDPAVLANLEWLHGEYPRFEPLRVHRVGGLGMVMRAYDHDLGREVAVKEIHPDLADEPTLRARLALEAEITGGLEHPGIVPVYARGEQEWGRPYYVMRFVRGESLKAAIDRHHRSPGAASRRDLLRRVIDVCHAIAYAHARGVVHRDLKPENIMLGRFGETLVVDWGMAHATGKASAALAGASEEPPLVPASQHRAGASSPDKISGTPAYMSPEQAAGDGTGVGMPADVYGLGATLYEVLTGRPPYLERDRAVLLLKLRSGQLARPRAINRKVPRALEAICLKAMAFEPADRYESSVALAEDLERYLAGEPVSARPDRWWRRLERFGRRHQPWIWAGLSFAVLLLLVVAAALARINQALADSRDRERIAFAAADRMYRLAAKDATLGSPEARPELRAAARAFYEDLLDQLERGKGDADRRALAHERLAEIASATGQLGEATRRAELAVALRRGLLDRADAPHDHQAALAASLNDLGAYKEAAGAVGAAIVHYQDAIALIDPVIRAHPEVEGYALQGAAHLENLGHALRARGRVAEARPHYDDAAETLRSAHQAHPDHLDLAESFGALLYGIGSMELEADDPDAADRAFAEAQAVVGRMPEGRLDGRLLLAKLAFGRARLALARDQADEADAWFDRAGRGANEVARLAPEAVDPAKLAAEVAELSGHFQNTIRQDLAAAEAAWTDALRFWGGLHARDRGGTDALIGIGSCEYALGSSARLRGDGRAAGPRLDRAIASLEELHRLAPDLDDGPHLLGEALLQRAGLRLEVGDPAGARADARRHAEVRGTEADPEVDLLTACAHSQSGEHASALAAGRSWAKSPAARPEAMPTLAGLLTLAAEAERDPAAAELLRAEAIAALARGTPPGDWRDLAEAADLAPLWRQAIGQAWLIEQLFRSTPFAGE